MNPFDEKINKEHFFNIKTGRKVNEDAENYLLEIFTTGTKKRDEFIDKCKEDATRFEDPVKKTKITNVATYIKIKQIKKSSRNH